MNRRTQRSGRPSRTARLWPPAKTQGLSGRPVAPNGVRRSGEPKQALRSPLLKRLRSTRLPRLVGPLDNPPSANHLPVNPRLASPRAASPPTVASPPTASPPTAHPRTASPPTANRRTASPHLPNPRTARTASHTGLSRPTALLRASRRARGLRSAAAVLVIAAAALAGAGVSRVVSSSGTPVNAAAGGTTPTTGGSAGSGGSEGASPFGGFSGNGSNGSGSSPFPFGNGTGGTGGSGTGGRTGGSSGTSEGAGGPSDVAAIAAKVSPAVVDVNVTFNYQDAEGAGTGIVLTSNGLVLTNNHVLDGATKISVTDVGNGKTYPATVVGYDSTHDVGLIQLQGASNLQTAKISKSSPSVGEAVVAIGNAGGTGGIPTSAGGSITAVGQSITANDELTGSSEQLSGLLEVNANIESGDSGGPLVNAAGEVVGMDTAASDGFAFSAQGNQGFAIPISEALMLAHYMESGHGTSTTHIGATAFIGLQISGSSGSGSGSGSGPGSRLGGFGGFGPGSSGGKQWQQWERWKRRAPVVTANGLQISNVVSGTPASKVGIGAGDVVTGFNGHTITTDQQLTHLLVPFHPGQTATITWVDTLGKTHTATITLASGPPA